ncbi:hypothetical protein Pcinc_004115 [Petrolisthes cinctipes]|uniref:Uncharacterized protein n=1 Tax=Petrolisthes cinctipes TaxID=88211 RepID=A0AAE1L0H1_PETCI|nr:hypothetical protein Pcinc_004115 [Petrolisthes cinctipes]
MVHFSSRHPMENWRNLDLLVSRKNYQAWLMRPCMDRAAKAVPLTAPRLQPPAAPALQPHREVVLLRQ